MNHALDQDQDFRIRERAYELWESEGRPEGQHERHWQEAKAEILAEQSAVTPEGHLAQAIAHHISEEQAPPRRRTAAVGRAKRQHASAR